MRRTICLLATAALLAMFCGCQSMPMLAQQDGPMPSLDTGNGVPEILPENTGESAIVENSDGQVIPQPDTPVVTDGGGMVYGGGGMPYEGCGSCGSSSGPAGYPYQPHGLHARNMHHTFQGPHGPQAGQITYPYYITKGPRDFLMNNPPSIGP